jgi:hypothetical protein
VTKHDVVVFDTGAMTVDLALDREKPTAVAQTRPAPIGRPAAIQPPPSPPPEIIAAPPPTQSAAPPPAPVPVPKSTKPDLTLDTGNPWAK